MLHRDAIEATTGHLPPASGPCGAEHPGTSWRSIPPKKRAPQLPKQFGGAHGSKDLGSSASKELDPAGLGTWSRTGRTDIRRYPTDTPQGARRRARIGRCRRWRCCRTWAGSGHAWRRVVFLSRWRGPWPKPGQRGGQVDPHLVRALRPAPRRTPPQGCAIPRDSGRWRRPGLDPKVARAGGALPLSPFRRDGTLSRAAKPVRTLRPGNHPQPLPGAARPRSFRFLCALGLTAHPVPTGCRLLASARAFGPSFNAISNLATAPRSPPHVATVLPPGCHSRRESRDFFG